MASSSAVVMPGSAAIAHRFERAGDDAADMLEAVELFFAVDGHLGRFNRFGGLLALGSA